MSADGERVYGLSDTFRFRFDRHPQRLVEAGSRFVSVFWDEFGLAGSAWEYICMYRAVRYAPNEIVTIGGVLCIVTARFFFPQAAVTLFVLLILLAMAVHLVAYECGRDPAALDFTISVAGIAYLGWVGSYLLELRLMPQGVWWLMLVLPIIWGCDTGAYAIGVLWKGDPSRIVGAKCESPLVVGLGEGDFFFASDIPAILSHTRNVLFLNDGEMVVLTKEGVQITTLAGEPVQRAVETVMWSPILAEKGGYKHFMLKEIYEQPRAVRDTIRGRFSEDSGQIFFEGMEALDDALPEVRKVVLIACGTAWHAALVGKFMIEELCRLPVEVDYSSEFRYRDPVVDGDTLVMAISQSGETLDTLAGIKAARARGCHTFAVCNVVGSSVTREVDAVLYTHAGPEIGVAASKTFTAQLVALYLFALYCGRKRGTVDAERVRTLLGDLVRLPQQIEAALRLDTELEQLAYRFHTKTDFLYLARGINYPIALEGALKLKEISYIHAEGYPAGEMKHGPIALITEEMPVVILAPQDRVYEKILGNIQEVKARGGRVIAIHSEGDTQIPKLAEASIPLPQTNPLLMPIISVIPTQLFSYHVADHRGTDVDQPRNLAKSVTVE